MREFASAFQILVCQDLPVFLLMVGLYENISKLRDSDNLTLLYRSPKSELGPLNLGAVASNYERNLDLDREQAREMAGVTKGYSFAFQVLGYLTWEAGGDYRSVIGKYRQHLEEYVYEKVWSELSARDREVARAIASSSDGRMKGIRERLGMTTNQFNPYRRRLILKGVVNGDVRGIRELHAPALRRVRARALNVRV